MWKQPERSDWGKRTTSLAKQKILIVDDELLAALPAATADKAIELAGTMRPNLVLMDIRLANNGDGVAAAIEIRERFDIPSLFVSAHGDPMTRDSCGSGPPFGFH